MGGWVRQQASLVIYLVIYKYPGTPLTHCTPTTHMTLSHKLIQLTIEVQVGSVSAELIAFLFCSLS